MKSNHIGDRDCKHNAHSSYLRCAVNPSGPCEGCLDYVKVSLKERLTQSSWALNSRNHSIAKAIVIRSVIFCTGGIPLGIVMLIGIVVPSLNSLIIKTHPCWPVIGVTQYCNRSPQHR
jgi:Family of unknown function (DUF6464)